MSAEITTKYLPDSEYDKWDNFVISSSHGTVYSLAAYLDALCTAVGGKFRILAAIQNDELVGGVALYERNSRFGPFVSPRLLLYFNGLILRDYQTRYPSQSIYKQVKIQAALEAELSDSGYAGIYIRNHHLLTDVRLFKERGWNTRLNYTYVVSIAEIESAWARVEQNLRRLIKRCEKQEMTCTEDQDFESFYRMHQQTHERKGAPLYLPFQKFQNFFRQLSALKLGRLYHARLPNNKSISSQLVLAGPCSMTHTITAAADKEFLSTGASAFLRWKVFEHLSGLGYESNELTDASLSPVTRFKSQLGGDLVICILLSGSESLLFRADRFIAKKKDIWLGKLRNAKAFDRRFEFSSWR